MIRETLIYHPKTSKKTYPNNIFEYIRIIRRNYDDDIIRLSEERFSEDQLKGLQYVLSTFSNLEQQIVRLRFQNKFTFEEIATELHLNREWVRQILVRLCTIIIEPYNIRYILNGFTITQSEKVANTGLCCDFSKIYIEELKISTRALNALKRHNINTVDQLMKLLEYDEGGACELMEYRNIGKVGFKEIETAINQLR